MSPDSASLTPDVRIEALLNALLASDVRNLRVLVAVSGGPDSTALLIALQEAGHDVVAAHYDHALREGSDAVGGNVAALCERLGLRLITERRSEPLAKGSLQAAARTLRYAFLDQARAESGAEVIALAHTADDLVEGVVLHLLRGCGLAGFRGMPARRGHYVRPFLDVWKSDVRDFLRRRGVVPHEDPANLDPRFARVRARLQILPTLERDRPGITRRFHAAALAVARLQGVAEHAASGPIDRNRMRSMQEPAAVETLKLLYTNAGGAAPGLSRTHIDAMLSLVGPGRGGRGVDLPGGLRFRIVGDHMEVVASKPAAADPPRLEVRTCPGCDDAQAAHLRAGLHLNVGFRRPGLRLRPAGGRGSRKLQDIFVDARVPREERDGWPLVFAGEKLAWVPGLAVDADLAPIAGQEVLHVAIAPMPAHLGHKVVRLETPKALEEI
ncbi:MAG: tRNA lysidine(34) synthetase TilS [Chloroflexi bacterium]|nr:MAG: tRNA lysidine(34) synthetase TilS [Chloroflexota bacterium]TME03001.1 MAG: tRNA lysidine(34) synthetase TilS [Chloroflexota bacterium]TME41445.1 MAG: tRNA lysidine(34) synthetase TilS [Chloroflexota bacterium]TME52739.1 MAG: tRNA lysidine(34) synthetase TilS [Chloroflexota bacterium]